MAILREKQIHRKPRAPRATESVNRLTPEEEANVRKALQVLRVRHGSFVVVARLLKLPHQYVKNMSAKSGTKKPSAGLAIRVARLAGVSVDDVLSGAFPEEGCCPMCGQRLALE